VDPTDIAEQLCLIEHALYAKVQSQECLNWTKTQTGKEVEGLHAFCATHDKLAAWVKMSILENDGLGKRSDTVDFWIKVAEVSSSFLI
jgi:son of sevenless-like protein